MGLRGGLRSTALEHPSFRHSGRSDKNQWGGALEHPFVQTQWKI